MAEADVGFLKGQFANLPDAKAEGTFYVTIDEGGLYLDVNDSLRIRIGGVKTFETMAELEASAPPGITSLYYVKGMNCLVISDGSRYIPIKSDTDVDDIAGQLVGSF